MFQKWRHLLFLHWRVDAELIQRSLPHGLYVDTFNNNAYLGIVPFFMRDVRAAFLPAISGVSNFLELNVRTYVHDRHGVPGVWFYSLDANQRLAVRVARGTFGLPYYDAKMSASISDDGEIIYKSQRRGHAFGSRFCYHAADGATRSAEPGSLDFFLIERYALFAAAKKKKLSSGIVHHAPYPLTSAEVPEWDDQALLLNGFESPARPPDHVVFSSGVDVEIFRTQMVTP